MINQSQETALTAAPPTMALQGISKSYAAVAALTDVSLEVLPGEVHALLGENGAGKSTLMGVASGTVIPDRGTITVLGETVDELTPARATKLGIAIVHQHPAVLPDLTIAENIAVAVPERFLGDDHRATMRSILDRVGCTAHLEDRVGNLSIAQKHLLELAKAMAMEPRLLILDEPTAPLGAESVGLLFNLVRSAAQQGTAVVYITHRLAEVRELADRVTVLRDGHHSGTAVVSDVTDDELLAMIVGRQLEYTFPVKRLAPDDEPPVLTVEGLSGDRFADVSLTARRGEIIGVAGVVGNGQSELLRALAGLTGHSGSILIDGKQLSRRQLHRASAYMPADRHHEGLMMSMSVRENAALTALDRLGAARFVSRRREVEVVGAELAGLNVKTATLETPVTSLSGGNQQKVVMARSLLGKPEILLADEPTQGVDVGARAEIYRILREVSGSGVPVVVASSDAKELEGLCDRVIVLSRGHVVAELAGDEVTEERMIRAAVESTTHTRTEEQRTAKRGLSAAWRRRLEGDYAPVLILAAVMVCLGAYIYFQNDRYLLPFNVTSVMLLVSALGFIALGQTVALMTGGIDLSVGPLSGFLVVVGSFFFADGQSGQALVLGLVLMAALAALCGLVNGSLIRFGKFTPVAATLATYIALQGFSFLLRDTSGGLISHSVTDFITMQIGPVPVAFVVLVVLAFGMEFLLRTSRWGRNIRAVGSDGESARRLGVRSTRTIITGYVIVSVFVFLGALILLAQLGIGDPAQGVSYTLNSIAAVVLGGTSLLGGRGTFIGTLLGAGLTVQLLNATTFLSLSQTWQYLFQGALIVIAALVYSQARGTGRKAEGITRRLMKGHNVRAARYYGQHDIRVEQVAEPQVREPDDVLVEVAYCGICGTDLHEYSVGPIVTPATPHPLTGVTLPQILGHEFSARVAAVGAGVRDVAVGDRVSIMPAIVCGRCRYCRRGQGHLCVRFACTGLSAETGGLAEYALVKEYQVARLPDEVSDVEGAVIEPAAVAAYGVERAGVTGGDVVLVTGAGPIGVLSAMYASAVGASTVIISEPNKNRSALAASLDIGPVVDPTTGELDELVAQLTDGDGVDLAVECSGSTPGLASCVRQTRKRASIVQTGLHTQPATLDAMALSEKDLTLYGSWCWRMTDWPRIIRMVASGDYPVGKAVTAQISLDDVVAKGFDTLIDPQGDQLKVLVRSGV